MGGGGLQLLPHKSWNVYSRKNREKVAKDEAEAASKALAQEQKRIQRDVEYRTEILRKQLSPSGNQPTHINLFESLIPNNSVNANAPSDEMDIICNRLGTTTSNTMKRSSSNHNHNKSLDMNGNYTFGQFAAIIDVPRPWNVDHSVNDSPNKSKRVKPSRWSSQPPDTLPSREMEDAKKKSKHHRHRHEKSHVTKSSCTSSIEKLRQERLRREKTENIREHVVKLHEIQSNHNNDRHDNASDRWNSSERFNRQYNAQDGFMSTDYVQNR